MNINIRENVINKIKNDDNNEIIKITSRRMQIMEKHNRFIPFFVFAFPSKVSCFICIPPLLSTSALYSKYYLF